MGDLELFRSEDWEVRVREVGGIEGAAEEESRGRVFGRCWEGYRVVGSLNRIVGGCVVHG